MQAALRRAGASALAGRREAAIIDQTYDAILVWDWEGAIIVVMAKIFDNDIRPDDRPAMNRAMTEWFSSNHPAGECPNESEIRKRAKKIFDALKTS